MIEELIQALVKQDRQSYASLDCTEEKTITSSWVTDILATDECYDDLQM